MQEPWKIFSVDLSSRNSYFTDETFYRNVLACFFAMNARKILVYLLLLYQDEVTLVLQFLNGSCSYRIIMQSELGVLFGFV